MSKAIRMLPLFVFILALSACFRSIPRNNPGPSGTGGLSAVVTPDLQLSVQVSNSGGPFNTVGQVINYSYTLQNVSSSTNYGGPVTIMADKAGVANCPALNTVGPNPDDNLDPGESITCTGTYSITQADLDAGKVTDSARATVAGGASSSNQASAGDVMMTQTRTLTLTTTADKTTYDQVGQVVTFNYVIANSGNVTLSPAQFTVNDSLIGSPVNCGAAGSTLQPGGSINCSAPHTVTQADLNANSMTSNATASDGTITSVATMVTVMKSSVSQPNPGNLTPSSTIQHTVVTGDWLMQIARCYGAEYKSVRRANLHIHNPSMIWAGQVVNVPNIGSAGTIYGPPCVIFHTAVAGDTWESLAASYNARLDILRRVNPRGLFVGARVKVPINSAGGNSTQVPSTKRINVVAGTPATETGTLTANGKFTYLVAASKRQNMVVTLTAPVGEIAMGIYAPNGATLLNPADLALTWNGFLPADGDYRIELASAAGITDKNYSLKVELTTPVAPLERVADIRPGSDSSRPSYLIAFNGALYFVADGGDGAGQELWKYDGTNASRAVDIRPGPDDSGIEANMAVYNGALYFGADGGDGAGRELWKYDGSSANRVADIRSGPDDSDMESNIVVYNGALYFSAAGDDGAGQELWKYDSNGASLAADIRSGGDSSFLDNLAVYNGALYFAADGGDGAGYELWKFDGSSASRVADIHEGSDSSSPSFLAVYNGALYFGADGGDGAGNELWKYDGSSANRVADIRSGPDSSPPSFLAVYNGALYFNADGGDGAGYELWKYDGTSASLAADILSGGDSSFPYYLAVYNGALYFVADGGDGAGEELWRYISP